MDAAQPARAAAGVSRVPHGRGQREFPLHHGRVHGRGTGGRHVAEQLAKGQEDVVARQERIPAVEVLAAVALAVFLIIARMLKKQIWKDVK